MQVQQHLKNNEKIAICRSYKSNVFIIMGKDEYSAVYITGQQQNSSHLEKDNAPQ